MDSITERQEDYIKILSSYPATKKEDEKDIQDYLKRHHKDIVSQLTKREASELIQILLQRPTEYRFPCGKKAVLHKQEVNSYHVLGEFEGCLHACPDSDVYSCSYWENYFTRV